MNATIDATCPAEMRTTTMDLVFTRGTPLYQCRSCRSFWTTDQIVSAGEKVCVSPDETREAIGH